MAVDLACTLAPCIPWSTHQEGPDDAEIACEAPSAHDGNTLAAATTQVAALAEGESHDVACIVGALAALRFFPVDKVTTVSTAAAPFTDGASLVGVMAGFLVIAGVGCVANAILFSPAQTPATNDPSSR